MRPVVTGLALVALAGLATYEVIALVMSALALGIAAYVLVRQFRWERDQDEREEQLKARAQAFGDAVRDDLRGD